MVRMITGCTFPKALWEATRKHFYNAYSEDFDIWQMGIASKPSKKSRKQLKRWIKEMQRAIQQA